MMLIFRFALQVFFVLSLSLCLSCCVSGSAPNQNRATGLSPDDPVAAQTSAELAAAQADRVAAQAANFSGARLWYAGFGLDSGSIAFRGDVLLTEKRLREQHAQTLSLMFDNELQTTQLQSPFAHLGNFTATIQQIAKQAKNTDVVTIMLSTHGNVKLLATQMGGKYYANIMDHHLASALQPLKDVPTILIISACHSGSLIAALQNENRIIMTAAAEKNVSYGCQPLIKNTFFIDALFGEKHDAKLSLVDEFEATKKRILARETELKLTPSEPQIFIGEKMKLLAKKPQNAWFTAVE